ncbi:MAG: beta-lactamase family protein [Bacteroidales bacterium]|nr:beta-lactamase family protein [Candidatus Cacconaster caballi]
MKKLTFALALAGLLLVSCKETPAEKFEKEMKAFLQENTVAGLSCCVVKDNQIIYNQNFGLKDITNANDPVDDNTIFRIASISKSFTATSFMQLIEQGKVNLKDDVSDLLGFKVRNPKFPDTVITLEMLLSHTSSINDDEGYYITIDVINPEINENADKCYNDYEPGKGYEYCNLNLNLAGTILERVSGERFDQYVVNHVVKPLELYAGYCVDSLDKSRFAHLYEWDGEKLVDVYDDAYAPRSEQIANYNFGHDALLFSPTGGMKISAIDLAKYMTMHMNYGYSPLVDKRIISEELSKNMQTPRSDDENYGLCLWQTEEYTPGITLVGHTGGAYGLRSAMFFNPEEKYGFTVICSGSNDDNILYDVVSRMYESFIK